MEYFVYGVSQITFSKLLVKRKLQDILKFKFLGLSLGFHVRLSRFYHEYFFVTIPILYDVLTTHMLRQNFFSASFHKPYGFAAVLRQSLKPLL